MDKFMMLELEKHELNAKLKEQRHSSFERVSLVSA